MSYLKPQRREPGAAALVRAANTKQQIRQGNRQMLSLSDALKEGRLDEFIAQEEARGVGPIDRADFDAALAKVVKAPQSKGRTSRSSSGDGSNEIETPQDSDPYISR